MGMPAVACIQILQERCGVCPQSSKLSPRWKHTDWLVQPSDSFHSRCPLSWFLCCPILLVQRAGQPMGRYLVRSGWASCPRELATAAYNSVPAPCAVGLCGCGYCAPWLWSASHGSRCSIRIGNRQVFPELQQALDLWSCSAHTCIFLECVAERPQSRL